MCLATPMKITEISGNKEVVESAEHSHSVDISLIKNPQIGQYVLAHEDMAINKLPKEEAEKILEMIKEIPDGRH